MIKVSLKEHPTKFRTLGGLFEYDVMLYIVISLCRTRKYHTITIRDMSKGY